jgi:predicted dehydrogenase
VKEPVIAFIGAGAVADYHAYALGALHFYYPGVPRIVPSAVTSSRAETRDAFATRHGIRDSLPLDDLVKRTDIDTVYILSPNAFHYAHLNAALSMSGVRRIYVEKPLCTTDEERTSIAAMASDADSVRIQMGFQFLHTSAARYAHEQWREGTFGAPIHFHVRYLHSAYLDEGYRARRAERLRPAPEGGAMVDLGSHAFSLAAAFLGNSLEVVDALENTVFPGMQSDFCTVALCRDPSTGAIGTVTASRVSAGAGELLEMEVRGTKGGFRFSSETADSLELFSTGGETRTIVTASDYRPHSEFPKRTVHGGWLRSLVHAQYVFISGMEENPAVDLQHGLTVQRLLLDVTRKLRH